MLFRSGEGEIEEREGEMEEREGEMEEREGEIEEREGEIEEGKRKRERENTHSSNACQAPIDHFPDTALSSPTLHQ